MVAARKAKAAMGDTPSDFWILGFQGRMTLPLFSLRLRPSGAAQRQGQSTPSAFSHFEPPEFCLGWGHGFDIVEVGNVPFSTVRSNSENPELDPGSRFSAAERDPGSSSGFSEL